jgi:hypothetical protein
MVSNSVYNRRYARKPTGFHAIDRMVALTGPARGDPAGWRKSNKTDTTRLHRGSAGYELVSPESEDRIRDHAG